MKLVQLMPTYPGLAGAVLACNILAYKITDNSSCFVPQSLVVEYKYIDY